jgi:hypothetical protein
MPQRHINRLGLIRKQFCSWNFWPRVSSLANWKKFSAKRKQRLRNSEEILKFYFCICFQLYARIMAVTTAHQMFILKFKNQKKFLFSPIYTYFNSREPVLLTCHTGCWWPAQHSSVGHTRQPVCGNLQDRYNQRVHYFYGILRGFCILHLESTIKEHAPPYCRNLGEG